MHTMQRRTGKKCSRRRDKSGKIGHVAFERWWDWVTLKGECEKVLSAIE